MVNTTARTNNNHENNDLLVGVIGGLGPEATIDFMERVMRYTPASIDQDHVRLLVFHDPHVPSRQAALLMDSDNSKNDNVGRRLATLALTLEKAGADFIVMPCNLGHYWNAAIKAAIHIPLVSIVDVTVSAAIRKCGCHSKDPVGLLTTPGCHKAGLYQEAFDKTSHPLILQTSTELQQTMNYVDEIKARHHSKEVVEGLRKIGNALVARGARVLIAACTELPLVLEESMFDVPFISSTDELAKQTVTYALGKQTL